MKYPRKKDLPWASWLGRRCRSPFRTSMYRGTCELKPRHKGDHAAERGMVWIRWNEDEQWYTTPGTDDQISGADI